MNVHIQIWLKAAIPLRTTKLLEEAVIANEMMLPLDQEKADRGGETIAA